ncbi:MAG: hypothetical protein GQ534_02960 [Candidatus Delongbacteria bacterium]|nr:hypothetical protein [Candidatus Delongbacteria bacterium]
MIVKNLKNTSDNTCKCNSWIDHWERYTKNNAIFCSVQKCVDQAKVGAHVLKVSSTDKDWYIVPLCYSCNKSDNNLDIGSTSLALANVNDTCG